MRYMSGWTWYCEHHDSFGMGDTELEVQHMANAHKDFYSKFGDPCHMHLKNQEHPHSSQAPEKPAKSKPSEAQPATHMSRVKANFARAWQKWDTVEDLQLIENFNARKDLDELTSLHQRAPGGIVARLKKLNLLDAHIHIQLASKLLAEKHEKLIKLKTFEGNLESENRNFLNLESIGEKIPSQNLE